MDGLGELTPHILKRMVDRQFTEVDIQQMLEDASSLRPDVEGGDGFIASRHHRRAWEIEPDEAEHVLVVITAYPVLKEKGS